MLLEYDYFWLNYFHHERKDLDPESKLKFSKNLSYILDKNFLYVLENIRYMLSTFREKKCQSQDNWIMRVE